MIFLVRGSGTLKPNQNIKQYAAYDVIYRKVVINERNKAVVGNRRFIHVADTHNRLQ